MSLSDRVTMFSCQYFSGCLLELKAMIWVFNWNFQIREVPRKNLEIGIVMTVFGFRWNLCSLEIEQAIQVAAQDINELQKQSPIGATVQRLQIQKSKLSSRYQSGNNHHESPCRF